MDRSKSHLTFSKGAFRHEPETEPGHDAAEIIISNRALVTSLPRNRLRRDYLISLRLVAIPALLSVAVLFESFRFLESFRLVTLVVTFILLADLASLSRGKVRDACVVLASIACGSAIVEGIACLAEPKIATIASEGLYASKPVVGWGPNHVGRYHEERIESATGRKIYSADYTIDDDLARQTHSVDTGPAVVFFGDSLTFGTGLNDTDTLPQQFADLLGRKVRILNLAYGGYGPSQFLRILQEDLFRSAIGDMPRAFVFLTSSWQAERTACKSDWARRAPRFTLQHGELSLDGTCRDAQSMSLRDWLHAFASYRMLVEPLILKPTDGDIELYIRTLQEAVRVAKERYGTRTIIAYLRHEGYLRNTARFTDEIVMARWRDGGALVVDASLREQEKAGAALAIPGDGHPTALANRLRAALLEEYMQQNLAPTVVSGLKQPSH